MAIIQVNGVDWTGDNGAGRVVQYDENGNIVPRQSGEVLASTDSFIPIGFRNDGNHRPLRGDRFGGLAIANNTLLFHEPFEGATISSPNRVTIATTTFTQAQTAAGGLVFNSGNVTTGSSAALLTTNRRFMKIQRAPLHAKFRARAFHVNNAVIEMGFGAPASQTVSPTVGAFFQVTAGGIVQAVLTFNGVDTTVPITMPVGWQNNFYTWDVILDDDEATFFIQDTATGQVFGSATIPLPATQARLWDASRLPVYARLHFPTAPATVANLILTSVDVILLDSILNKPTTHIAAQSGFGGEVNPSNFTQAANYANSAAPTSATLSNTAAGYTTLGGQFQFAAVAGAETDYALFGFTVPIPYSFICTGIDISTFNLGAAVATTATVLQWFASPDQTAISLATGTNRRVTLGTQSFAVGAAIGANADREIIRNFNDAPLVTNPGRIFVVGLKMPVGTATASQIIRGTVAIKGYFE